MCYRPGGPGNSFARRAAALRSIMLDTVGEDDLKAIVAKLVEQAKAGDVVAAREVLTRIIGRSPESPDRDRLDTHETALLLRFNRLRQEAEAHCGELNLALRRSRAYKVWAENFSVFRSQRQCHAARATP